VDYAHLSNGYGSGHDPVRCYHPALCLLRLLFAGFTRHREANVISDSYWFNACRGFTACAGLCRVPFTGNHCRASRVTATSQLQTAVWALRTAGLSRTLSG